MSQKNLLPFKENWRLASWASVGCFGWWPSVSLPFVVAWLAFCDKWRILMEVIAYGLAAVWLCPNLHAHGSPDIVMAVIWANKRMGNLMQYRVNNIGLLAGFQMSPRQCDCLSVVLAATKAPSGIVHDQLP
jgi:hypothetical protein